MITNNKSPRTSPILIVIFLAVLGIIVAYIHGLQQDLFAYMQTSKPVIQASAPIPVQTSIVIVPDPDTLNWPIFTSRSLNISFKYPPNYEILNQSQDTVVFGFANFPYLTISSHPVNYNKGNLCTKSQMHYPCVSSITWGQTHQVEQLLIGSISAEGYYITSGVSESYHIVTLNQNPSIQFSAFINQASLDQTFQKMLSTVTH